MEYTAVRAGPHLTGFLALRVTGPLPIAPPRWGVDPAVTLAVGRWGCAWATLPDPDARIHLRQGRAKVDFAGHDPLEPVTWALLHDYSAGVVSFRTTPFITTPFISRSVNFSTKGQLVLQVIDGRTRWSEQVEDLRQAIVTHAERLDVAFLRRAGAPALSWTSLAGGCPPLPTVGQSTISLNRHLWGRYVPDAHSRTSWSAPPTAASDSTAPAANWSSWTWAEPPSIRWSGADIRCCGGGLAVTVDVVRRRRGGGRRWHARHRRRSQRRHPYLVGVCRWLLGWPGSSRPGGCLPRATPRKRVPGPWPWPRCVGTWAVRPPTGCTARGSIGLMVSWPERVPDRGRSAQPGGLAVAGAGPGRRRADRGGLRRRPGRDGCRCAGRCGVAGGVGRAGGVVRGGGVGLGPSIDHSDSRQPWVDRGQASTYG